MSAPTPYVTEPFRQLSSINNWQQFLFIQQHSSYFLHVVRSSVSCGGAHLMIADALLLKHSCLWFIPVISLVFFHIVRAGAYWHKIHDVQHVHLLYKQNSPLSRLDFFFNGPCGDIVRLSIETGESVSLILVHAVVYFTLVDLLETKKVLEATFRDCYWCISIPFASVYFDEN